MVSETTAIRYGLFIVFKNGIVIHTTPNMF